VTFETPGSPSQATASRKGRAALTANAAAETQCLKRTLRLRDLVLYGIILTQPPRRRRSSARSTKNRTAMYNPARDALHGQKLWADGAPTRTAESAFLDGLTFTGVSILLLVEALVASMAPAYRVAQSDQMSTLRNQLPN